MTRPLRGFRAGRTRRHMLPRDYQGSPGRLGQRGSPKDAPPQGTFWSDGSRLEDGRAGAGIAWRTQGGNLWHTQGRPMGKEAKVFDAELKGVVEALQEAVRQTARDPVTTHHPAGLPSGHSPPGTLTHQSRPNRPGQTAALEAVNLAQVLVNQGQTVAIQ